MGLDQYAHIHVDAKIKTAEQDFYWRKHSRLQDFMEELWVAKTGRPAVELNCEDMELTLADLNKLEGAWHNGYEENVCEGGFFYGHQFQEDSCQVYKDEDYKFIHAARQAIADGKTVIYSCWW